MGEHAIKEVYPNLLDGDKFISTLQVLSINQFRLLAGGMIGEKLEGREVKCKKGTGSSFLNWSYTPWQFVPFTGKVQWYIGMGWDTVGDFDKGVLQKQLIWTDHYKYKEVGDE